MKKQSKADQIKHHLLAGNTPVDVAALLDVSLPSVYQVRNQIWPDYIPPLGTGKTKLLAWRRLRDKWKASNEGEMTERQQAIEAAFLFGDLLQHLPSNLPQDSSWQVIEHRYRKQVCDFLAGFPLPKTHFDFYYLIGDQCDWIHGLIGKGNHLERIRQYLLELRDTSFPDYVSEAVYETADTLLGVIPDRDSFDVSRFIAPCDGGILYLADLLEAIYAKNPERKGVDKIIRRDYRVEKGQFGPVIIGYKLA
jgi:hypothetical protein